MAAGAVPRDGRGKVVTLAGVIAFQWASWEIRLAREGLTLADPLRRILWFVWESFSEAQHEIVEKLARGESLDVRPTLKGATPEERSAERARLFAELEKRKAREAGETDE